MSKSRHITELGLSLCLRKYLPQSRKEEMFAKLQPLKIKIHMIQWAVAILLELQLQLVLLDAGWKGRDWTVPRNPFWKQGKLVQIRRICTVHPLTVHFLNNTPPSWSLLVPFFLSSSLRKWYTCSCTESFCTWGLISFVNFQLTIHS